MTKKATALIPNTRVEVGERIVGWVGPANTCTRPDCKKAQFAGRPFHAIPRDGELADYHFATIEDAKVALIAHFEAAQGAK